MRAWVVLNHSVRILALIACAALSVASLRANTITFTDRASFLGQLANSITDDFENSAYKQLQSDADLTAVLNETRYRTTGFANNDLVFGLTGHAYCAGCNGSFQLLFDQTTIGDSNGVFGAGLDVVFNDGDPRYQAFVTFGDGSTGTFTLPDRPGFFGITSSLEIKSIDFGLADGGASTKGDFAIDNLTIGSSTTAAPEPNAVLVIAGALVGMAWFRRKRPSGRG